MEWHKLSEKEFPLQEACLENEEGTRNQYIFRGANGIFIGTLSHNEYEEVVNEYKEIEWGKKVLKKITTTTEESYSIYVEFDNGSDSIEIIWEQFLKNDEITHWALLPNKWD